MQSNQEPDSRPADLNENGHLLDGKDELNNEALSEILGGIEVQLDLGLGALCGDDSEIAALNIGWDIGRLDDNHVESWDDDGLHDVELMSEDYELAALCHDSRTEFSEIAALLPTRPPRGRVSQSARATERNNDLNDLD